MWGTHSCWIIVFNEVHLEGNKGVFGRCIEVFGVRLGHENWAKLGLHVRGWAADLGLCLGT